MLTEAQYCEMSQIEMLSQARELNWKESVYLTWVIIVPQEELHDSGYSLIRLLGLTTEGELVKTQACIDSLKFDCPCSIDVLPNKFVRVFTTYKQSNILFVPHVLSTTYITHMKKEKD